MNISDREHSSILTAQTSGFLAHNPYPFTHSLSPYTGCEFGKTACGTFCYAPTLPSWTNLVGHKRWGDDVSVKVNAAQLLRGELHRMGPKRMTCRIFMSPATDAYQPIETKRHITRDLLDVFKTYDDLDLLVVQTRSPLAMLDFDIMPTIPYLWLSVTIETDLQDSVTAIKQGGPTIAKRFEMVTQAARMGIHTQIAVSPCLRHSLDFAKKLIATGTQRIVVDNFVEGDGSRGARTAESEFARVAAYNWRSVGESESLYRRLKDLGGVELGWSSAGFCGIKPKPQAVTQPTLF